MGYILNLRKRVGHQPLISTGAAGLVYNASAQLLFVHRSDTHLWDCRLVQKKSGSRSPKLLTVKSQKKLGFTQLTLNLRPF